jgi:hypothetical protein
VSVVSKNKKTYCVKFVSNDSTKSVQPSRMDRVNLEQSTFIGEVVRLSRVRVCDQ